MIGDIVSDIFVGIRDMGLKIEVIPYKEVIGGDITFYFPDGKGKWGEKTIEGYMTMPDNLPILTFSKRQAEQLYTGLKKIFDPKDSVSIDAHKIQSRHLEDMRRLAFNSCMGVDVMDEKKK